MSNTIEGRLRNSVVDTVFFTVVTFYLLSRSMYDAPLWVAIVLAVALLGYAISIFKHRGRRIIVKYDDQGVQTFTKTLRGKQKEAQVAWRKVYGIEKLSQYHHGLIGKDGNVVLKVPIDWEGVHEFTAVVLAHLDKNKNRPEQLDYYLPRVNYDIFSPGVTGALAMLLITILVKFVFTPGEESVWLAIKLEISVVGLIFAVATLMHIFRLRSLHINDNELVLRYPLWTRRLNYEEIASVQLVEDPSKPVRDEARRIRINLKGRSRHYILSEFTDRVAVLYQSINRRFEV